MGTPRILLIDDEVGLTDLLRINLEDTGRFEVRVENRGARALAAAREFQPDVIFLDIIMPDMDGAEIASQIREDPRLKDVPIVYLTAIVSKQETMKAGGVIGGNEFLAKPVALQEAVACIEKHLQHTAKEVDR